MRSTGPIVTKIALAAALAATAAPAAGPAFAGEEAIGPLAAQEGSPSSAPALAGISSTSGEALAAQDAGVIAARARVSAAQEGLAAAQAAADASSSEARKALEDGAFAFFAAMGADDCLEILNTPKFDADEEFNYRNETIYSQTIRGGEGDATSTENMIASVKFLRECNELRAKEGVGELTVTLPNMAIAMWNSNWSAMYVDHAPSGWNVGEDLAYGYDDHSPFDGWYYEEKSAWESGQCSKTDAGHYFTLINPKFETMGFAINTRPGSVYGICHAIEFNEPIANCYPDAERMTVDEYETLLTGWVDEQKAAIENTAEAQAVKAAQAELDAANAALEKAEAPYSFADVDYSLYYGPTVAAAAKDGLMSGYSGSTSFGPEDVMTRGQLATVLWRVACPDQAAAYDEAQAENATGMGDVEGGKYYTAAANWAVSAGVINGFEVDGHREFHPYEAVTMEQLCCIMANLAGADVDAQDASALGARYVDADSISGWARTSVAYGGDQGWFSGYENPDGTRELKPYEALSRGRAATMLMNMGVK